jgi:hypothetical protein
VVSQPVRIDVRAYNVGFGDCLLVSFHYARKIEGRAERHMLIDFGTNKTARGGPSLREVAELIEADSGGKLDVVVVTHRHRDHLSGFDPAIGGTTIARLAPDAIVRPWTEDPAASDGGTGGHGGGGGGGHHLRTAGQRQLLDILEAGHRFAASVTAVPFAGRLSTAESALFGMAAMQLGNANAVALLDDLAAKGESHYLRFGDPLKLAMLPGVSIEVLGPPDPDTWPAILRQAAKSKEYWLGAGGTDAAALKANAVGLPVGVDASGNSGRAAGSNGADAALGAALLAPGPGRWLIDRLDDHLVRSAERLVHQLDGVLNNTSLVLLIEAGGHRMLFPGDAEVENWTYALTAAPDREEICERLRGVDLYKVGHHGSRNATPKQALYPLLASAPPAHRIALMSTLAGFYDKSNPVPNQALLDNLGVAPFELIRTDETGSESGAHAVHLTATKSEPFKLVG